MLSCPPQAPLRKNCRAGPVCSVQEMRAILSLRRCFFAATTPQLPHFQRPAAPPPARSAREKKPAEQACFASLLRQNRQAELASLKDDLLRCLLFGVDPIESDKETQKFESQSVASGQGKPPRVLVVLLRRETRSLHTQKRQIGSQISTK